MNGDAALRQAIRRIGRLGQPDWLCQDLEAIDEQLTNYRRNLRTLEIQKSGFGLQIPLDLLNEIEICRTAIQTLEQKRAVLLEGWQTYLDKQATHVQT